MIALGAVLVASGFSALPALRPRARAALPLLAVFLLGWGGYALLPDGVVDGWLRFAGESGGLGALLGRAADASPWAAPARAAPVPEPCGYARATFLWNLAVGLLPLALLAWRDPRYGYALVLVRFLLLGVLLSPVYYPFWGWYLRAVTPLLLLELGAYALAALALLVAGGPRGPARALLRLAAGLLAWAAVYEAFVFNRMI